MSTSIEQSAPQTGETDGPLPRYAHLRHELDPSLRVAIVTLARPPVNAVNQEMYGEIRDLFGRFEEIHPEAAAVVLRASGRHFCAGNDLHEFLELSPQNSPGRMKLVREAFAAIYDCPVPVVGAVHGSAAGTGLAIAACCDVVVCGTSARFSTPEVGVGVMGGARHLRRMVPEQVMRWMYFTTEPLTGEDLQRYGSVLNVVPDEELLEAATAAAARIARHSPVILRTAKEALNSVEGMDLKPGYEAEQHFTHRLSGHPHSHEARRSIVERRAPRF